MFRERDNFEPFSENIIYGNITCRPCPAAGNQSEEAYGRKMTGEGPTYWERKTEQVECGDCGKDMAAGSLESHQMI